MSQIETVNKFVTAMTAAEGKLKTVADNIESSKDKAEKLLERFETEQKDIIAAAEKEITAATAKEIFDNYKKPLEASVEENTKKFKEYLKATKFIRDFEKMFIVSVFGKVKSGKSYLGNYIMGRAFKKTGVKTRYDELGDIKVTVYDRGKLITQEKLSEMEEGSEFGVDSLEATSTIQYFNIGAMTWIDTPGIGSITKQNEELAEEYIKNSDLVVFALNSDAAGTRQEMEELKELYGMGKPMLIAVTQSDAEEEDVDDDGELIVDTVPKSQKDRDDVENYLKDEISKNGLDGILDLGKGEIITISTKLAVLAAEKGDENKYDGSNIDELMERLIEITENDAAKLKIKNPQDRFNKLLAELSENMKRLEDGIRAMTAALVEQSRKTGRIKAEVIGKIKSRAYDAIDEEMRKARKGSVGGKMFSGKALVDNISEHVNIIIREECVKGMSELIPKGQVFNANIMSANGLEIEDIGEKVVTRTYEVEVVKRRRIEGGIFRKIRDFFLGAEYETYTTTEKHEAQMSLGDNSAGVQSVIMEYFEKICSEALDDMIDGIVQGCNKPLTDITGKFAVLISDTEKELAKLKINLK